MQLGEAFIQLSMQLPPSASKDVEASATKTGQAAAKAFSEAADKATHIEAKDAFKQFPDEAKKAGTTAGTALGKAVSDASSKMVIKSPDITRAYAKAGDDAGKALATSVNNAAAKMTIKSPDITNSYKTAGEKAGQALAKSVNETASKTKVDAPDVSAEFSRAGDKAGTSFKDKLKGSFSNAGNIGEALGVQLIGAFNSEVDFTKTQRNFEQSLGATKGEAKALGLAAGSLFANGLADGMDEAEQAISATINSISGIRDQGAPAIKEIASAALGVSKAFGQDLDGVLRATGQLMRTGLAKDGKEALDIIAGGLQKIPGAAEDLLDTFQEYSVQFKKIGLDGKDALGIISQLMEGGARNTDLAADALKEFSIRAVDGSSAVEGAFKDLGLDAEKMTRTFAEGGPKARQAFGEVVDALNKMEDPLKRNQAGVELFGTQWEDLGDAFRKADLKTATKELGDLDGVADRVGGNTFGEKLKANLSKLSGVATGIAATLGISFASSFDEAIDFKSANEKVARELGLSGPQAKEIGKAAGDLYSSGLGDGLGEVQEAIGVVGKSLPSIAKLGVPALSEVTKAALKLQKNFDVDIADSSNAVGKLIQTGLVKNATEGFDLIATGMQKIPRAGEDLIDTVNEYSVQFQKLGLTGQDTFGLIQQLMKGGARDTDLAADAIKEFSIRAVDGSSTSMKAFKDLGFNAKELTATFARGGPEARAAFGQVTDALNKMEDPVKRNATGVALFGTQWEDLGGAFKSVDLKTAASGLGDISKANAQVVKTSPTQVVQQFQRAIQVAFIEILADKVIPAFAKFIEFVKNNQGLLKTLAVTVGVLGTAYVALNTAMAISAGGGLITFIKTAVTSTKAWTAAQFALNAVMKANPIGIVVTAVTALIAILVVLYKNNETVRKVIDAAWAAIKKAMGSVIDWFTGTAWPALKKAWDAIKPAVEAVGKAISTAWDAVKKVFTSTTFIEGTKKAFDDFKGVVTGVWKVIQGAVQVAWSVIKGIFDTIKAVLNGDFKGAWTALGTMIKGVWDGIGKIISGAWQAIKSGPLGQVASYLGGAFKQAWDGIKGIVTGAWDGVKSAITNAWNGIKSGPLGDVIRWLGSTFTAAWKALQPVVEAVWNGIKTVISVAWTAIKVIFAIWLTQYVLIGKAATALWKDVIVPVWNGIKDAITTAWNTIKTAVFDAWQTYIKGPFTTMWTTFKTFMETLWNGIKTFLSTTWNTIKTTIFDAWQTYIKGPFQTMWTAFKTFFETLWNGLKASLTTTWTNIKTGVFIAWETYIKGPFMTMWNTFKAFFETLWNALKTFITTTWTTIKTSVFDAWQTYIKGPFTAMWNAFKTFLTGLWTAIKTLLVTTWAAIKTTVFDAWQTYIKGPFTAMWNTFKGFLTTLWGGIKTMISAAWGWIKSNVFEPLSTYIRGPLVTAWNTAKTGIVNAWNAIKTPIKSAYDWIKSNVFTPLSTLITKTVPSAFTTGVNAIKSAWGKIEDAAKTPVRFVANTVLRDGLFKAYNSIASKVNAPQISYGGVGFARGGVLPGYTPGRDVHMFTSPTGGRLALSGGEAIMRPEFTRAVGAAGVERLNAAARAGGVSGVADALGMANGGVLKFEDGGVVDNTWDAIKKGVAKGFNGMKAIAGVITKPLTGIVDGLLRRIPGAGPFIDLMKAAVKSLIGQGAKFLTGFGGGGRGGGGVAGVGGGDGAPIAAGYQAQIANLAGAGFHLRFAPSQLTQGGHAKNSWHYKGRAIDIGVGTNGQSQVERVWDYLVAHYAKTSKELFWAQKKINYKNGQEVGPHDLSNHIHWAMRNGGVFKYDDGGWLEPGQTGANMGKRPEAVLTPEESAGLKGLGLGELIDKLDELIDAVERVAPGVTAGIRGAGAGLRAAGRAV